MRTRRYFHTAILLSTGDVLLANGNNAAEGAVRSCEVYAATAGQFRYTANDVRDGTGIRHLVETTGNRALRAGGHRGRPHDDAWIFDPTTEMFTQTGDIIMGRVRGVAVRFPEHSLCPAHCMPPQP